MKDGGPTEEQLLRVCLAICRRRIPNLSEEVLLVFPRDQMLALWGDVALAAWEAVEKELRAKAKGALN